MPISNPENSISKHLKLGTVTDDDIALIRQFIAHKQAAANFSPARESVVIIYLVNWRRYIKVEYRCARLTDIELGISAMRKTKLSQNTIHDYTATLKMFLKYLSKNHIISISTDDIREEIHVPSTDRDTTHPSELLSTDDVLKLVSSTGNMMHKALLAVAYESAARPAEVARLQWRDAVTDAYGIRLHITDTKTKKRRMARLTFAAPYVSEWKRVCTSEYMFPTRDGSAGISWSTMRSIMRRAGDRARIEKKMHLYLMRKSRITQMVRDNYNQSAIKATAWGNQSTLMMATYVRLSDEDTDMLLLQGAGITPKPQVADVTLAPITCPVCHTVNRVDADHCQRCGSPISERALAEKASSPLARLTEIGLTSDDVLEALQDFLSKKM